MIAQSNSKHNFRISTGSQQPLLTGDQNSQSIAPKKKEELTINGLIEMNKNFNVLQTRLVNVLVVNSDLNRLGPFADKE